MDGKQKPVSDESRSMQVMTFGTRDDRINLSREILTNLPLKQATGDPKLVDRSARGTRYQRATAILQERSDWQDYVGSMLRIQRDLYKPALWDSSLEIVVTAEFMRRGYECVPQVRLRGFTPDLYVPALKLFVEADGDYYHSTEESDRMDRKCLAWALACGYLMARLPERDIMKDLRGCVDIAIRRAEAGLAYVPRLMVVTDLEEQRQVVADMLETIGWNEDPGELIMRWMAQQGNSEERLSEEDG